MKLQLVSKETALLAKELGFDWRCIKWFSRENKEAIFIIGTVTYNSNKGNRSDFLCTAPEQELLAKWLRDKVGIRITIHTHREGSSFNIEDTKAKRNINMLYSSIISHLSGTPYYNTYEDAMEEGLLKSLKLRKIK